ncbi:MAG: PhoX family protein [Actinomycetota bacterium]|nr:PhoX family protein [Actinomycetota bacterium]
MSVSRRDFLVKSAATAGGLAIAGPLAALGQRLATGAVVEALGYGPLVDKGPLSLPKGFRVKIISREGDPMSDGNPTPSAFDGMAAFKGRNGNTILIRNHENRALPSEIPVVVPLDKRYDVLPLANAGCTKLVVNERLEVVRSFAVLGGTITNCAGGKMPWGSWITSEEQFVTGEEPHGYNFEIPAGKKGATTPEPIRAAGRFVHEAVAWTDGALYETEDQGDSSFYRYTPETKPTQAGDLAKSAGRLQALAIKDQPTADTRKGWPLGKAFAVTWVDIEEPDPSSDSIREEAQGKGAAIFAREEGIWVGNRRIYFDCTSGGDAGLGQIWEYDPRAMTLTLIFESKSEEELKNPDNLTLSPLTGDLFLCEDTGAPQFVRGLTKDGRIYDFAKANDLDSEFAGACFSPDGRTLFVNQHGGRRGGFGGTAARTYAIRGPWTG